MYTYCRSYLLKLPKWFRNQQVTVVKQIVNVYGINDYLSNTLIRNIDNLPCVVLPN